MRHAQIMEIVERYIEHRDANLSPPAPLPLPSAILRNFAVEDFFPFFPSLDDSVAPPGPSPTPPTTRSETSVVPPVAQLLGPQGRRWPRHASFKARSSRSTIGPTSHELFNAQGSTRNHRIEPDYSETRVKIFIAILSPSHESRSTTSRPPSARAVAASAICGNRDSREVGDENEQGGRRLRSTSACGRLRASRERSTGMADPELCDDHKCRSGRAGRTPGRPRDGRCGGAARSPCEGTATF